MHRNVDFVDKQSLGEKAGGSLTIKCKDLKVIRVDIMNNEEFASVVDSIEKLSAIGENSNYAEHETNELVWLRMTCDLW